jgi:hypothetical protein
VDGGLLGRGELVASARGLFDLAVLGVIVSGDEVVSEGDVVEADFALALGVVGIVGVE